MSPATAGPWRGLALLSVLLIGASLGVLAERLVLAEEPAPSQGERSTGEIWFDCTQAPRVRTDEESAMRRSRWVADVRQALSLDDRQTEAVDGLLIEHSVTSRAFWDETREMYCTMQGTLRQDVRELLRPEQMPLFEDRIRRIDEKLKERHQRTLESDRSESDRDR